MQSFSAVVSDFSAQEHEHLPQINNENRYRELLSPRMLNKDQQNTGQKKGTSKDLQPRMNTFKVFFGLEEENQKERFAGKKEKQKSHTIAKNEEPKLIEQLIENNKKRILKKEGQKPKGSMFINELWDSRYYKKVLSTSEMVQMHDKLEKIYRSKSQKHFISENFTTEDNQDDEDRASTARIGYSEVIRSPTKRQTYDPHSSSLKPSQFSIGKHPSEENTLEDFSGTKSHEKKLHLPLINSPRSLLPQGGESSPYSNIIKESYKHARMGAARNLNLERHAFTDDESSPMERNVKRSQFLENTNSSIEQIKDLCYNLMHDDKIKGMVTELKKESASNYKNKYSKTEKIKAVDRDGCINSCKERINIRRNYELTISKTPSNSSHH